MGEADVGGTGAEASTDPRPAPPWLVASLRAVGRTLVGAPRPLRVALVVAWATWIWFLSSSRLSGVTPLPFASVLGNLAHGPVFGLLGLFAIAALAPRLEDAPGGRWPRLGRGHLVGGVALVLAYALVDEVHQSFTPGRSPSLGDVATDVLGAGAVAATIRRLDPRGADGRGLLGLWAVALGLLVVSATIADLLGFVGLEATPG